VGWRSAKVYTQTARQLPSCRWGSAVVLCVYIWKDRVIRNCYTKNKKNKTIRIYNFFLFFAKRQTRPALFKYYFMQIFFLLFSIREKLYYIDFCFYCLANTFNMSNFCQTKLPQCPASCAVSMTWSLQICLKARFASCASLYYYDAYFSGTSVNMGGGCIEYVTRGGWMSSGLVTRNCRVC
jgi:hypothetical protein